MSVGYSRPATIEDAHSLAPRMREIEVEECRVLTGHTPLEALVAALDGDAVAIVTNDGHVVGMAGTAPYHENVGSAWFLCSDELFSRPDYRKAFLRGCKQWIEEHETKYDALFNWVDARNVEALRWVEWLGFRLIHMEDNFNGSGQPYYQIVRYSNV